LVGPVAVAIDSGGNAWVANLNGNSIVKVTSTGSIGSAITGGRSGGSFSQPSSIAVDKSGNVWTANLGYGNVVEFSNKGTELSSTTAGVTDSNTIAPMSVAVDTTSNTPAGNVWLASTGAGALDGFNNSGTALTAAAYSGGGLTVPFGLAIDGASNVWTVNGNSTTGTLSKLSYSGGSYATETRSSGLGSLNNPVGVAVDASGNMWVANHGDNSVTEFLGIATPASTPLTATVGP
jgi:streptogramin lyase